MAESLKRFQLDKNTAVLVVVDVQERLVPAMKEDVSEKLLKNIDFLLSSSKLLELPVLTTEQYPKGLGHTVEALREGCAGAIIEKTSFGCCGEPKFMKALEATGRHQVIVTGMEAHVCVYQTVLGLLAEGYQVHLVQDAICSRKKSDFLAGVENAARAGATVTSTEMAVFQMLADAKAPQFKEISKKLRDL